MRMWIAVAFVVACVGSLYADEKTTSKVEGTFVLPDKVKSFEGRVVEIRLYKYDPRIADKEADLVEKVEIKDFSHTQGKETKKDFVIGAKAALDNNSAYYITFFILQGNTRTHMGEAEHSKKDLCKVLTSGQPNKIKMTVIELK